METHAHHIHKAPGNKFWHFFFEFFMLFLAVSAGFYAENLREEIKYEKEIQSNMRSLLTDLKTDVAYFNSTLAANEFACSAADSLIALLNGDRANTAEIYYLARIITANFNYYLSNQKTFDQMKFSGALKLIKPRNLLDSISDYYAAIPWLESHSNIVRMKVDEIHLANSELFNAFVFEKMMHIEYTDFKQAFTEINKPEGNPALLTNDFKKINDVALRYHYFYSSIKFYDKTASQTIGKGKRLIELIKEEYHLE